MADSRITKKAMASAMKELMAQTSFDKISVGDICARCEMSRKSFYYHFCDKYELVNWIFSVEFMESLDIQRYEDSWIFFGDLCTYFLENRAFYVNALCVTGQNSFREYFRQVFGPLLQDTISISFEKSEYKEFYATFFVDALLMAIERWLQDGTVPPDEFVRLLRLGIEGTAMHVIEKMKQ